MQKFIDHQHKCLADGTKNFGEAVNTVLLECEALLEETVESPSKKLAEQERLNQSFFVRYRLLIFLILLFAAGMSSLLSSSLFSLHHSSVYGH